MNDQLVVLLHGLARTFFSMKPIEKILRQEGYQTLNFNYRATKFPIEKQAQLLHEAVMNVYQLGCTLNFVTHSLGGIVARQFIGSYFSEFKLGRMVMLGPPNQGSRLAKFLNPYPPARWIFGPALSQLANLAVPNVTTKIETGIIASGRGKERGLLPLVSGDNDGIVWVEETRLDGAKDWILLSGWHGAMMLYPRIKGQTLAFLRDGKFEH